jgi:hypothetical protein
VWEVRDVLGWDGLVGVAVPSPLLGVVGVREPAGLEEHVEVRIQRDAHGGVVGDLEGCTAHTQVARDKARLKRVGQRSRAVAPGRPQGAYTSCGTECGRWGCTSASRCARRPSLPACTSQ